MKNESDFKSKFKKSVTAQQGVTISLSAPVFPGIPDLYCVMPGFAPVLIEAKWLGVLERDKFSRKMQYTGMQLNWIQECNRINTYSALGMAGFKYQNSYYTVLVPYNSKYFSQVTEKFLEDGIYSRLTYGEFDVLSMFEKIPIPRLNYAFGPTRRIAGVGEAQEHSSQANGPEGNSLALAISRETGA